MPFEFLRRLRRDELAEFPTEPIPEETPAQEYELRLLYHAKSSEGVRMSTGSQAVDNLPSLLEHVARGPVEVIEPLPVELSDAAPIIERPLEASQWLEAHAGKSPVSRHAVLVLETVGAIDLAYDTVAVSLLHGDVDTSGYPEFNAIVGGVASHWDEATGDLIIRAVTGWGGRGVRGDTDRVAQRLLSNIVSNILASQYAVGMTSIERPVPAAGMGGLVCASCGFASADERAFYCPRCGVRLLRG